MSEQNQRVYLVDGSSYIYRAYYAIRHLSNSKGEATNAVYGFTNMLLNLVRDEKPDKLAVVFDAKGPTFRKELYPEYKANRSAMPEDLVPQVPIIKEVVRAFNMPALEQAGVEADDIIATLAKQYADQGLDVVVVTGDKDLMQIVSERVCLLDTMKNKISRRDEVIERFGVPPEQVLEVLGLAGDTSDNIPGVPGIGEKTAATLIQEFGSIDNLLQNIDQVKGKKRQENLREFGEQALLSRKLADLLYDVELDVSLDDLELEEPNREALTELFKTLEFHKLLQEFSAMEQQEEASGDNYQTVLTEAELDEMIAKLREAGRFAFDTETTSLVAVQAELVGLSFAVEAGHGWYVPVGHMYLGVPEQLPKDLVLEKLRSLLEDPQIEKIGQNIKYDALVLRNAGVELQGCALDTMLLSYVVHPEAKSHGLDALAAEHLNHRMIPYSEICGTGKKQICFSEVEVEKAAVYAAEDADITWRLAEKLLPELPQGEPEKLLREVEMPLVDVLTRMEWRGIRIDADFLGQLSTEMAEKMKALEDEIYALAEGPFNINSPKQLGEVLFEKLGLPKGKKTKTGWSTNVEVLTNLAEDHEIAAKILEYRSLSKLKGTYTDALPKLINPKSGRIHTSFNQAVTATGRLSSSDPNLQNIPIRTAEGRRIREAFIPEEGWALLAADYSQVELRVMAHMADVPALKESFAAGEDIHKRTASEIFNVFPEMVDAEMRRQAKTINFGVLYGMGAFSLGKDLGIGRNEAQQFIDNYFERYPAVKDYLQAKKAEAQEHQYVTTILGRRCAIPEINSKNGAVRSYAERNAINYPIQGSAADIIKVAMVNIDKRLREENLQTRMLLQVHDELVFEVPPEELEQMTELVRSEMESAVPLDLPLKVDIGTGKNWAEAH
ncbi:DNA polymerase I [Malonomonas rubra DSM 5091]|uniref:DNA polymerase I n=1 Tax=Malonomonas rubra DSM 5091 TaxID=1122189 RepID=A0A1M6EXV5_MALRU|nr:DNA polymerase I [Malonomonas rubra]SHI90314.1 DNA polymerase I [Malonomonas rubra DSM 5091]